MTAGIMQNISQIAMLVGAVVVALGIYGNYHYGKIADEGKNNSLTIEKMIDNSKDVNATGNQGQTQVMVDSPNSQQIINNKKTILSQYQKDFGTKNGLNLLTLTFKQSDGIWDSSEKLGIQVQLTGAYESYQFISGIPMALQNVRTTQGVKEAAEKGWIDLQTTTTPLNENIILEILSKDKIDVATVGLSPLASN